MTESFETPLANSIPDEDIAKRAYELYESRGRQNGHDVEDWLRAEQEVEEEQKRLRTSPRAVLD
jgi:hypothetical protein